MRKQRLVLILGVTLLIGSIAIGAIWQAGNDEGTAPASRSIFPKVLNH